MLLFLRQVIDCIERTVGGLYKTNVKIFSVHSAMHDALLWSCVGTVGEGDAGIFREIFSFFLLLMIIIVDIRAHTGCATWTRSYCRASFLEQSPWAIQSVASGPKNPASWTKGCYRQIKAYTQGGPPTHSLSHAQLLCFVMEYEVQTQSRWKENLQMFMDRSDVYGKCVHLIGMPVLLLFSYLIIPCREQVLLVFSTCMCAHVIRMLLLPRVAIEKHADCSLLSS